MPASTFSALPDCAGIALKPEHYHDILDQQPAVGFFEVHAENYLGAGGPPHRYLSAIRADHALSIHGVGASIGGSGPLAHEHLRRLRRLVDCYQPAAFSEHLAWSSHGPSFLDDLLPLPYTDQTLSQVVEHVAQLQDALDRTILLENPATYVRFAQSTWSEPAFLAEVAKRSGCGLLLDVNNVFVASTNLGFDAHAYLDAFALHRIAEIHLAGHNREQDEDGHPLLIDTHDRPVASEVWAL